MYDREMISKAITSPFTSNLTNEIARREVIDGFREGVRAVIVAPGQVDMVKEEKHRRGNGYTRCGMIIGYPYGGMTSNFKTYLADYARKKGLDEVDVGIPVTAVKSGDFDAVQRELKRILDAAGPVKVIPMLWMVKLPFETIDTLCRIYIDLGIDTVKTSAGIHFGEIKTEHVSYLYKHYGDHLAIEVAGRVRSRQKAEEMSSAGASCFHISQWRRIGGIGRDIQFDFQTKEADFGEYRDRM